jgi:signal transduction histidine kinase
MTVTTWQAAATALTLLAWVLLLLSVSACCLLIIAGFRRLRRLRARQGGVPAGTTVVRQCRGEPALTFAAGLLDVGAELETALATVMPDAARTFVELEIAAQPGLAVRADPLGFHEIVTSLLLNAIGHTPCGRVLLTAVRLAGDIRIAVTDDGVPPSREVLARSLAEAEGWAALHGANLDIELQPGEGTTVAVRLPAPPLI